MNATSSTYAFNIQGTGSVHPLQVGTSTNASMLVVRGDSGNVGVGTAVPAAKLEVVNNGDIQVRLTRVAGQYLELGVDAQATDYKGASVV